MKIRACQWRANHNWLTQQRLIARLPHAAAASADGCAILRRTILKLSQLPCRPHVKRCALPDEIEFARMDRPRVRFAPSPTGYLHVGGARTALFNWLFARRHGGTFILRIEDTDTERSSDEMVAGILESMRWLGLDWDEGPGIGGPHAPYFQTQRFERHKAVAHQLLAAGSAYKCYCSPESAEGKARSGGKGRRRVEIRSHVSGSVRRTSSSVSRPRACSRRSGSRCRQARRSYTDHVRGRIEVDHEQIEDFVILRSNGLPIYHLSVVADDIDMGITHVIRGDDHISNTPKHILLWQALGRTPPEFAHVPLILGTDKKKLSKRHGITSVTEYERLGYLPDAMVNFLGAARVVAWRRSRGDVARRADRRVFARRHQRRRRGLRSREARLVQRAVPRAAEAGRSRRAA